MEKFPDDIVNKDIILFALYELGGARGPVHTFHYPSGPARLQRRVSSRRRFDWGLQEGVEISSRYSRSGRKACARF